MSTIVIIGSSSASVSAAQTLRTSGFDGDLTIFCPQGVLPYDHELFPAWIAKDTKESQVFIKLDKFTSPHKVKMISQEKLTRVSTKRRQLTTEDKTHIPFDQLLITDLPAVAYPLMKGSQKEGVFNTFLFPSVKTLVKTLHEIDNVVVKVSGLSGLEFACALSRAGKDVVILSPKEGLLISIFDEETSMLLKQILEARGIRVIYDDMEEILGDAQVKAVRLHSGKVMAAEAVLFDNVTPDLRMLSDADLLTEGALKTDEFFRTPVENVFAAGSVVNGFGMTHQELAVLGKAAAQNMLRSGIPTEPVGCVVRDFGHKVCDGFYAGEVRLPHGGREYMRFDGPSNIYKKIYLSGDQIVGAVWMNAPGDKERVIKALTERQTILGGQEEQFL